MARSIIFLIACLMIGTAANAASTFRFDGRVNATFGDTFANVGDVFSLTVTLANDNVDFFVNDPFALQAYSTQGNSFSARLQGQSFADGSGIIHYASIIGLNRTKIDPLPFLESTNGMSSEFISVDLFQINIARTIAPEEIPTISASELAVGLQLISGAPSPIHLLFQTRDGGQAGVFFDSVVAVPEPATWLMMIIGFAGVGFVIKRRRRLFAIEVKNV